MITTKTKPKKKTKRRRKDGKECHDNDDVLGCNQWLGMPKNELHTKNIIKLPYFTGRFVYFLVLNTILDFEKSASAHAKNRVSPVRIWKTRGTKDNNNDDYVIAGKLFNCPIYWKNPCKPKSRATILIQGIQGYLPPVGHVFWKGKSIWTLRT